MVYLNSQGKVITNASGKTLEKVVMETKVSEPLPVEIKTFQMKSGSLNVPVTPYIKIVDSNFRSWGIEEWHNAARARNFNKEGVAPPIGFELNAWNKHFCFLMKSKYMDAAGSGKTYYDVTGTQATTNGGLRHSAYQHSMDIFYNGATRAYTIGSTTVSGISTVSGDTVILSTSNSPFKWYIDTNIKSKNAFTTNNPRGYFDAQVAYTDWYRTLISYKTDILTGEPDGTIIPVEIKNASGTRPTPVTDDMYFYINGVNTGILAKYNPTGNAANQGIFQVDNLTQAMADAIYNAQKANGVTMNDDYASLSSGATKVVLTEGCKGAEAYAYGGYWYIMTPALSRGNGTTLTNEYNIPDSPALSWVKWYNSQFSGSSVPHFFMPDERMLEAVQCNRPTCLNSVLSYLNNANGDAWGMQGFPTEGVWSPVRGGAGYAWVVYLTSGNVNSGSVNVRCVACGAFAL